jgi:hypothetical protein
LFSQFRTGACHFGVGVFSILDHAWFVTIGPMRINDQIGQPDRGAGGAIKLLQKVNFVVF